MKKTSVYLEEAHLQVLKGVAAAQGRSQAEVIRDAILRYAEAARQSRDFACAAVADGPGGSVADVPQEELLRGFGEWR